MDICNVGNINDGSVCFKALNVWTTEIFPFVPLAIGLFALIGFVVWFIRHSPKSER